MSHHEKEGGQEDAYTETGDHFDNPIPICLCAMQLFCCVWVLRVQFEDKNNRNTCKCVQVIY